jgi:hypothetical protein
MPPPGRGPQPLRRCLPAARGQRGDVLHLEEEVRAPGRQRAPPAAVARRRERAAEAARRGPLARQTHPHRGLAKKSLRPTQRRELAGWVLTTFGVSCVRACHLAQFSRTAWYRRSRAKDQAALRRRIREIAHVRPRFRFLRIWVLLRREGRPINKKRVRRLYRLEGLQLRMRVRRRKHIALHRGPAPTPVGPTERWSMDFVHDALANGRPVSRRRGGRSMESTEPASRSGVEPLWRDGRRGARSGAAIGARPAVNHGRPWDGVHVTGP